MAHSRSASKACRGRLRYHVQVAGHASREFQVTLLQRAADRPHRPVVHAIRRLPTWRPRSDSDTGDIYAPEGSQCRSGDPRTTTAPVERRRCAHAPARGARSGVDGAIWSARSVSARYRVSGGSATPTASRRRRHRVLHPPARRSSARRAHRPAGRRQQVTPLEEVTIEARADDDYGVDRLELVLACAAEARGPCRLAAAGAVRHRTAHGLSRGSRRQARRLRDLLRPGARYRPRQAARPRRAATSSSSRSRRLTRSSRPRRARRWRGAAADRRSGPPAEGHHRRHVEVDEGGRCQRGGRRPRTSRRWAARRGRWEARRDRGPRTDARAGRAWAAGRGPAVRGRQPALMAAARAMARASSRSTR